jgi:Alpha-kinase family
MTTTNLSLIIDHQCPFYGYVSYARDEPFIGRGSFKTTTRATLTWQDSPAHGLGLLSASHQPIPIALKRPYAEKRPTNSGVEVPIKRFNFDDESRSLHTETTMLGWAESLLTYAYNFIRSTIRKRGEEPPMPIPSLRFVYAVLAYAQKSLDTSGTSSSRQSSSHRAVYLLEELLPLDKKRFIKYIHNGDAIPNVPPGEDGYETASFLSFIQHVQYQFTGGNVYISDFQGSVLPRLPIV